MRKLLIKLFVLDYIFKFTEGKIISFTRDAPIIIGIVLMMIPVLMFNMFNWLWLFIPLFIATYFAFLHFRLWPAQYAELTQSQKWQYGKAVQSGQLTDRLTDVDWKEWTILNLFYENKYK